jgi:hypothetical protein
VLAQARPRKPKLGEPEVLDLPQGQPVVEVDVQPDAEVRRREVERAAKELREEAEHVRIGVCKLDGVAALRSFRPVEHAARNVKRITAGASPIATGSLMADPARPMVCGPGCHSRRDVLRVLRAGRAAEVPVDLIWIENDVAGPVVNARRRHTKSRRDALDRHALLTSKTTCFSPFRRLARSARPYEHMFVY